MPYEIVFNEDGNPTLKITLESGSSTLFPFGDVADDGRNSLAEIIENEFNRIIREATLTERNRIQQGIKGLLGIRGTGRQE